MMLVDLFRTIDRMETEIGNQVKIAISKDGESALRFRAFWPDGFLLTHRFDVLEMEAVADGEVFILHFIDRCKQAHPNLMPYMS